MGFIFARKSLKASLSGEASKSQPPVAMPLCRVSFLKDVLLPKDGKGTRVSGKEDVVDIVSYTTGFPDGFRIEFTFENFGACIQIAGFYCKVKHTLYLLRVLPISKRLLLGVALSDAAPAWVPRAFLSPTPVHDWSANFFILNGLQEIVIANKAFRLEEIGPLTHHLTVRDATHGIVFEQLIKGCGRDRLAPGDELHPFEFWDDTGRACGEALNPDGFCRVSAR